MSINNSQQYLADIEFKASRYGYVVSIENAKRAVRIAKMEGQIEAYTYCGFNCDAIKFRLKTLLTKINAGYYHKPRKNKR